MAIPSLEERVTALEMRVERLQQELNATSHKPCGWQKIVGAFADNPSFEDAVRHGREWRESQGSPSDENTS